MLAPAGAARGGGGGGGAAALGLELLAAAPRGQVHRRLVDQVVLDGVDADLEGRTWKESYYQITHSIRYKGQLIRDTFWL